MRVIKRKIYLLALEQYLKVYGGGDERYLKAAQWMWRRGWYKR